ncbi:threonylcarbamoyladenylate synthase [Kluyveromyces lactis]|uniref:Threonylcarbamoyl-AMP synthase n=1 Tax=Kluyveromyces lactis (strain ATCC 8585 / CBS 2359 / DSM 70799 / NBRC 1267 / NRRL Y-1140 / WM37) TaxID=284590 RepID=Q6CY52_KLULA|nr:uncharacterized protein KLLA0_A03135g [Kluyveromyces lactis]CAH02725.1 KLLA0A03135p [Kluyveromyces lactis]|eukprot:XP_451137.1 uncharacterized protein KLLA0_A03135g [Kluyveromyces lactis]
MLRSVMKLTTRILKVDPAAIHFSDSAHIDGSLPTFTCAETEKNLLEAAGIIRDTSETVAFPTETVYGLGGSALNDESVKNIYKAKNRPSDNPLITHISSLSQLNRVIYSDISDDCKPLSHVPEIYHPLVEKLWPGPLTILLSIPDGSNRNTLSKLTTANQPTFACRIPANPIARALIALSDTPIAAPSANASTRPSPTTAEHVFHDLNGRIPLILDGGKCSVGVESTVVDGLVTPPMLLRPGGFTYENILNIGGPLWKECLVETKVNIKDDEKVKTPGMKYRHYSPKAKVILLVPEGDSQIISSERLGRLKSLVDKEIIQQGAKKVAFLNSLHLNKHFIDGKCIHESLGTTGKEIQANLFALLRKVDEEDNVDLIVVEGTEANEEGLAIMNRLRKAASNNIINF